jgi:hypothetical protein
MCYCEKTGADGETLLHKAAMDDETIHNYIGCTANDGEDADSIAAALAGEGVTLADLVKLYMQEVFPEEFDRLYPGERPE